MTRNYKDQFDQSTVDKIQDFLNRLASLRFNGRASHYYKVDLDLCLRGGALLGALHVVCSLLEILVREIEIQRSAATTSPPATVINFQRELEKQRNVGFKSIVDNLFKSTLISKDSSDQAKEFYDCVRIPLHHGLVLRFVENHKDLNAELKLLHAIFGRDHVEIDADVGMSDFEEVVEETALELLDTGLTLIEKMSQIQVT